jgi:hypothetical protein
MGPFEPPYFVFEVANMRRRVWACRSTRFALTFAYNPSSKVFFLERLLKSAWIGHNLLITKINLYTRRPTRAPPTPTPPQASAANPQLRGRL